MARQFAIHQHHVEPLSREAFGHQRAGNPAADDQRLAADVFSQRMAGGAGEAGEPGRTAAMQIVLLGNVGIEVGNGGTGGWNVIAGEGRLQCPGSGSVPPERPPAADRLSRRSESGGRPARRQ